MSETLTTTLAAVVGVPLFVLLLRAYIKSLSERDEFQMRMRMDARRRLIEEVADEIEKRNKPQ